MKSNTHTYTERHTHKINIIQHTVYFELRAFQKKKKNDNKNQTTK